MDIFYINRKVDNERRFSFITKLKSMGSTIVGNVTRVEAVDPSNLDVKRILSLISDTVDDEVLKDRLVSEKTNWVLCIYLSHLKALLTFLNNSQSKYAIIMEDDCDFLWSHINWSELLRQIKAREPKWEVIKIYRNFKKSFHESSDIFTRYLNSHKNSGAVAYIVERSAVERAFSNFAQVSFPNTLYVTDTTSLILSESVESSSSSSKPSGADDESYPGGSEIIDDSNNGTSQNDLPKTNQINLDNFPLCLIPYLTHRLPKILANSKIVDTERLMYLNTFDPNYVLQLNYPIIGHS